MEIEISKETAKHLIINSNNENITAEQAIALSTRAIAVIAMLEYELNLKSR